MKKLLLYISVVLCWVAIAEPIKSMLGADGSELQEEWSPTAVDYIMDGLVRHVDSLEVKSYGDYSREEGTVVYDLVNNSETRLIIGNSCEDVGNGFLRMIRDLNDQVFVHKIQSVTDALISDKWTMEFFGDIRGFLGYYDTNIYGNRLCDFNRKNDTTMLFYCGNSFCSAYVPIGEYVTHTIVRDGSFCKAYVNGKVVSEFQPETIGIAPNRVNGYFRTNTEFGEFRFYSHALTDNEVMYNHIIDKMRFGL